MALRSLRLFERIFSSGCIRLEDPSNLVTDAPENGELLSFGAGRVSGIIKSPMMPVDLAGEHRASLIGIAADRDDCLDGLIEECIHVLGCVSRDVDADLIHYLDRQGMDVAGGL